MLLLSKGHHGMGLHVRPKVGSNVVAAGGVRLESEPKSTGELYSFTGKVTGTITIKNGNSQKITAYNISNGWKRNFRDKCWRRNQLTAFCATCWRA